MDDNRSHPKREIKFRAWEEDKKRIWSWEDMLNEYDNDLHPWFLLDVLNSDSQQYKIMQYTGLKDKNGKEIYDGDIFSSNKNRFVVEWCNGAFIRRTIFVEGYRGERVMPLDPIYTLYHTSGMEMAKIIGNIYENPELLLINYL